VKNKAIVAAEYKVYSSDGVFLMLGGKITSKPKEKIEANSL
jgi:hypothetical protein